MVKGGAWVLAVVLLLDGCSSGGSGASASGTGGAGGTAPGGSGETNGGTGGDGAGSAVATAGDTGGVASGGTGSGGRPGKSNVTVRVANAFLPKGKSTGLAIDIYDDMAGYPVQPSVSGRPRIAGIPYGTISDYVIPDTRFADAPLVQLVALPAGSPPTDTADAQTIWGGYDEDSELQVTVLLTADAPMGSFGPLNLLSYREYVEKGVDQGNNMVGPLAPAPPAGEGAFLVELRPIGLSPLDSTTSYSFLVDDSCPQALPFDYRTNPYGFQVFPLPPSVHKLAVAGWNGSAMPPCEKLLGNQQGASTVTLAQGQQIIAFVYGSSMTDLHLMLGPLAP